MALDDFYCISLGITRSIILLTDFEARKEMNPTVDTQFYFYNICVQSLSKPFWNPFAPRLYWILRIVVASHLKLIHQINIHVVFNNSCLTLQSSRCGFRSRIQNIFQLYKKWIGLNIIGIVARLLTFTKQVLNRPTKIEVDIF